MRAEYSRAYPNPRLWLASAGHRKKSSEMCRLIGTPNRLPTRTDQLRILIKELFILGRSAPRHRLSAYSRADPYSSFWSVGNVPGHRGELGRTKTDHSRRTRPGYLEY